MSSDTPPLTYLVALHTITWGNITVTATGEDEFIEVTPNSPLTTSKVGADGTVAISYSADASCTAKITLQQGSPVNNLFTAAMNARTRAPLLVKDGSSDISKVTAAFAWISARPAYGRGKEAKDIMWEFGTGGAVISHGGSLNL